MFPKNNKWWVIFFGFKYFQLKQEVSNQMTTITDQQKTRSDIATPIPSSSSTAMPTAKWLTYENSSLGFKIQYPSNVEIKKEFDDEYNRAVIFKGNNLHFEVMLREQPQNFELSKYYYMDNIISEESYFKNQPANIYKFPDGYCDGPGCSDPYISTVFTNSDDIFHINFFGDSSMSEIENKILDSFEFTNK